MTIGIGSTDNGKSLEKCWLRHSKKLFELASTLIKSFGNFREIHKKKSVKE
jgi:hypothetical protein